MKTDNLIQDKATLSLCISEYSVDTSFHRACPLTLDYSTYDRSDATTQLSIATPKKVIPNIKTNHPLVCCVTNSQ